MRKILIATGGTGGHLFPAHQLAEELTDCEVLFAGYKLSTSPFFNRNFPFVEIASSSSLKRPFTLIKGVLQSLKLILKFSPDVVVGLGSFHSFPLLFAATLLRKKIVLFELNCSLGKVNRFFAPFAKKIAFQFPIPHKKAVYVPLLPWKVVREKKEKKEEKVRTILVFGGSQGASFLNQTFFEAAKLLSFPFQVIHLTGKKEELNYLVPAIVKPFERDMASIYEKVDFAVCRCGAGTTAELIRYNIPAVLIPYPYAHNHQRKNGEFLGLGVRILDQKDASVERLAEEIEVLNANLKLHKQSLKDIVFPKTETLGTILRGKL